MHILHHHQFLLLWGTLQNVWSAFIAFSVDGLSMFLPNRSCKAPLLVFISYLKPEKPQKSLGFLLNFSYPSPDLVSVAARSRHPLPGSSSNVSYNCLGAVPISPWAAGASLERKLLWASPTIAVICSWWENGKTCCVWILDVYGDMCCGLRVSHTPLHTSYCLPFVWLLQTMKQPNVTQ